MTINTKFRFSFMMFLEFFIWGSWFVTFGTSGMGMLIGFWAADLISDFYQNADGNHIWKSIWLIPAGISVLVLLLFKTFFKK